MRTLNSKCVSNLSLVINVKLNPKNGAGTLRGLISSDPGVIYVLTFSECTYVLESVKYYVDK